MASPLDELPPAPQAGNVARTLRGTRLAQKSLHLLAILERHGADAQRRRDRSDEAAERRHRQLPHLDLDGTAPLVTLPGAHHARTRRREIGQRVEPVLRRGAAFPAEPGAAL